MLNATDKTIIEFLSTPSGWRATNCRYHRISTPLISIHALRVEGDDNTAAHQTEPRKFLSTPSGWRATSSPTSPETAAQFLSTPSGWRATFRSLLIRSLSAIFLSTPSGWRATSESPPFRKCNRISIHALRVEGDVCALRRAADGAADFYPRPPGGGRRLFLYSSIFSSDFYPRPPGGGRLSQYQRQPLF